MIKVYYKIDSPFERDGKMYHAEETNDVCMNCVFLKNNSCAAPELACAPDEREDDYYVRFVENEQNSVDVPIGQKFKWHGRKYRVEKSPNPNYTCEGCAFWDTVCVASHYNADYFACELLDRYDETDVIFKDITDEPLPTPLDQLPTLSDPVPTLSDPAPREYHSAETKSIPAGLYRRLDQLGLIPNAVRDHNVGASDYAKHLIQPWAIWQDYDLNPWDADIIKRILRTKSTDTREADYEKIIHICQERLRQLKSQSENESKQDLCE